MSGPTNEKDASLKAERHLLTEYKDYNLIFFPLTESHIKYIKEESGIDTITGVNIIDNNGVVHIS